MRGGSSPKKGGQAAQALGRSRGGFSTKIHVSVDSLGNPLRFILTGGQQHDITQAEGLIAGYAGEHVLADQGYDAQEFRQHILELGMMPVIPPRSNRKEPADYDRHLYRERHLVECFINKMKHYRRIFSRFEKLDTDTWASCISPPLSSGSGKMSTEPSITTTHLLQDTGCMAIPFVDVHPQTIAATLAVRSIPEAETQAVVVILGLAARLLSDPPAHLHPLHVLPGGSNGVLLRAMGRRTEFYGSSSYL